MNKTTALLFLIIFIILTLPIFFITVPLVVVLYNSLIKKHNQVQYAFSGVDVALQMRGDLVPNVVESVRKYMDLEQNTLMQITELRSRLTIVTPNSAERFQLENNLTALLRQTMLSVESYPQLKASENMMHLQRTLTELEEQISASRRAYNAAVVNLNNAIETFPTNVVAGASDFQMSPYFTVAESAKHTPDLHQLLNR